MGLKPAWLPQHEMPAAGRWAHLCISFRSDEDVANRASNAEKRQDDNKSNQRDQNSATESGATSFWEPAAQSSCSLACNLALSSSSAARRSRIWVISSSLEVNGCAITLYRKRQILENYS